MYFGNSNYCILLSILMFLFFNILLLPYIFNVMEISLSEIYTDIECPWMLVIVRGYPRNICCYPVPLYINNCPTYILTFYPQMPFPSLLGKEWWWPSRRRGNISLDVKTTVVLWLRPCLERFWIIFSKLEIQTLQYGFTRGKWPYMASLLHTEAICENLDTRQPTYVAALEAQKAFDIVYQHSLLRQNRWGTIQYSVYQPRPVYRAIFMWMSYLCRWHSAGCWVPGRTAGPTWCGICILYTRTIPHSLTEVKEYHNRRYQPTNDKQQMVPGRWTPWNHRQLYQPWSGTCHFKAYSTLTDLWSDTTCIARRTAYAGFHGNTGISPSVCRSIMISTYIIPRLLFGLEAMILTDRQLQRLEVYLRQLLRKLQNFSDRVANSAVLLLIGIPPVAAQLHIRTLTFLRLHHAQRGLSPETVSYPPTCDQGLQIKVMVHILCMPTV